MLELHTRIKNTTLAAIGNREVTLHEIFVIASTVAPACGYKGTNTQFLVRMAEKIANHNIPDQIKDETPRYVVVDKVDGCVTNVELIK